MNKKCQTARQNMPNSFRNMPNKPQQGNGCQFRITWMSKGKKCDVTLEPSLEAPRINTVLNSNSAMYSYRKFLIRNTYKYLKQYRL